MILKRDKKSKIFSENEIFFKNHVDNPGKKSYLVFAQGERDLASENRIGEQNKKSKFPKILLDMDMDCVYILSMTSE